MQSIRYKNSLLTLLITVLFASILLLLLPEPTHAVTTVPTKMNFQGRLTNSAGTAMADGTYNMKFRLYDASTAGTLKWSEDRLVSAGNGVTVTNGLFSVQLGSVTALTDQWFQSGTLYLEIELPTPATATSSSPTWGDVLTPRNQLATSAYAFNSETLDGLDSSEFARVDTANTFSGFNEFYGNSAFYGSNTLIQNSADSTSAFQVQNAAGTDLLQVDSANSRVYIGDTVADATGAVLVLDTKNTSGDPTGVNGGMYYNSNTGDFRCYVSGAWQSCQAHSASVAGLVSGGTTTISTTSYTNLTSPSSLSYTKLGGSNTNLVITMSATMYATVSAGTSAYLGVNINSTDYDCGNLYFNQLNIYNTVSCSVTIPNLSAGAKTIQMRWKRGLGTGSLNSSSGAAWNSMTVTETN